MAHLKRSPGIKHSEDGSRLGFSVWGLGLGFRVCLGPGAYGSKV